MESVGSVLLEGVCSSKDVAMCIVDVAISILLLISSGARLAGRPKLCLAPLEAFLPPFLLPPPFPYICIRIRIRSVLV